MFQCKEVRERLTVPELNVSAQGQMSNVSARFRQEDSVVVFTLYTLLHTIQYMFWHNGSARSGFLPHPTETPSRHPSREQRSNSHLLKETQNQGWRPGRQQD